MKVSLICSRCGRAFSAGEPIWRCRCGGFFDLVLAKPWAKQELAGSAAGMWRYRRTLPLNADENIVSFGEGATPLLRFAYNKKPVWLKLDYLFPTGSFKDRGASLLVSKMKELRVQKAVEDSSGNAGAAIAAYCARAGIQCEIYVPAQTLPAKIKQIEAVAAMVRLVPGTREETARAALAAAETSYYAGHAWNPFFLHGVKTCAFELYEQLGEAPAAVFAPVGNGTLLLGLYIGFCELRAAGLIENLPALFGVQSSACAPLAEAFAHNLTEPATIRKGDTLADGIAVAMPVRGGQILQAVRKSRGALLQVSENEIAGSLGELHRAGLYVEPTAAAAWAGYRHLCADSSLSPCVVVLTGHGLKHCGK
ncbi:MAG: pyridoxal-phosphate dependent enzyme [candidate division KSB1 bacterium]|nr:pyridoxal-phosphate dependent enzyme [candidate division KSB1 bacterium]